VVDVKNAGAVGLAACMLVNFRLYKGGGFLNSKRNYQIFKKDSAPCNQKERNYAVLCLS
jgi:hypothetical protein